MTSAENVRRIADALLAHGVPPAAFVGVLERQEPGACDVCGHVRDRIILSHVMSFTNIALAVCMPCGTRINDLRLDMAVNKAFIDDIGEEDAAELGVRPLEPPSWFTDAIERAIAQRDRNGD